MGNVESKLENDEDFEDLERNSDVVGLLEKLEEMAFARGVQNKFWKMQHVLRRLAAMQQGHTELLTNYKRRFES